jgi:hypothetical protein
MSYLALRALSPALVAVFVVLAWTPIARAGWQIEQQWQIDSDVSPNVKVVCPSSGYGQGNGNCTDTIYEGHIFAEAVDAASFCDITAAVQGTCTGIESWQYIPDARGDTGRIRVSAHVKSSGNLAISDGPASVWLFLRSRFKCSSLGLIESIGEKGKSTEVAYVVPIPIPGIDQDLPVQGNSKTGSWPLKASAGFMFSTTPCLSEFSRWHFTDLSGEAWADGGFFGLDLGQSDLDGDVKVTSALAFKYCPEPFNTPTHPASPPPVPTAGPSAKPGTGGGAHVPSTGGSGPSGPTFPLGLPPAPPS